MPIKFEFLEHGDCTIITTDKFTMMVDGGSSNPFRSLKYKGIKPEIDSIILTHIDGDHIGGIISYLTDPSNLAELKYIFFNEPSAARLFNTPSNSANISKKQGNKLKAAITDHNHIEHINCIYSEPGVVTHLDESVTGSTQFVVLSPDKMQLKKLFKNWVPSTQSIDTNISDKAYNTETPLEDLDDSDTDMDSSLTNASSLAFLVIHNQRKFLILGDAHITQVTKQLISMGYRDADGMRLKLDFVKLSHHGSRRNTSKDFLSIIETEKFIVSKSSFSQKNPDRETIAKLAKFSNPRGVFKRILINTPHIGYLGFTELEKQKYQFSIEPIQNEEFSYL